MIVNIVDDMASVKGKWVMVATVDAARGAEVESASKQGVNGVTGLTVGYGVREEGVKGPLAGMTEDQIIDVVADAGKFMDEQDRKSRL